MEWVKLGDYFEAPITGEWGENLDSGESGSPVIRTTNFTNEGKVNYDDLALRRIDRSKKENKLLKKGDIIIEKSGGTPTTPVGRVVYFEGEENKYFVNNFTAILRAKEGYNSKYLFYLLFNFHKVGLVLKYQNKTTGIINLKLKDYLKRTHVELPDSGEQEKIVKNLEILEASIAKRREQIDALDALVDSVFYEMFGDPNVNPKYKNMVKLGDLGEWKSGGTPKRSVKEYYGGTIPWVTSGELNEIYICDALEKITRNAIAESNAKFVEKGSLLLGMYDSAGLKSSINLCTLATNQAIAFSKLNSEISNTIYIYHLIQIQRESLIQQQRGVRQKNFNLSMIKDINVTLPPIGLQNRFADYVTSIEAQKESLRASLSELETLFDALMQEAFSGHLNQS